MKLMAGKILCAEPHKLTQGNLRLSHGHPKIRGLACNRPINVRGAIKHLAKKDNRSHHMTKKVTIALSCGTIFFLPCIMEMVYLYQYNEFSSWFLWIIPFDDENIF